MGADGLVYDATQTLKIDVDYYKELFRSESRGPFSLERNFWEQDDLVSLEENADLEAPFSEEEIKSAVFWLLF
jgi:hypothetical protein